MCVKDGNKTENEGINRTAREYQSSAEKYSKEVIEACIKGSHSTNEAELKLAGRFGADPGNFKAALQELQDRLGTSNSITKIETRMVPGGRVNVAVCSDNTVKAFECTPSGQVTQVVPNPAFSPIVVGSSLMFQDNSGGLHRNAEGAAAVNQGIERSGIFNVTGGNCPQNPRLVPDFVPAQSSGPVGPAQSVRFDFKPPDNLKPGSYMERSGLKTADGKIIQQEYSRIPQDKPGGDMLIQKTSELDSEGQFQEIGHATRHGDDQEWHDDYPNGSEEDE